MLDGSKLNWQDDTEDDEPVEVTPSELDRAMELDRYEPGDNTNDLDRSSECTGESRDGRGQKRPRGDDVSSVKESEPISQPKKRSRIPDSERYPTLPADHIARQKRFPDAHAL